MIKTMAVLSTAAMRMTSLLSRILSVDAPPRSESSALKTFCRRGSSSRSWGDGTICGPCRLKISVPKIALASASSREACETESFIAAAVFVRDCVLLRMRTKRSMRRSIRSRSRCAVLVVGMANSVFSLRGHRSQVLMYSCRTE